MRRGFVERDTLETKIKEYIEGRKSFIDICNDLNCGKTPL